MFTIIYKNRKYLYLGFTLLLLDAISKQFAYFFLTTKCFDLIPDVLCLKKIVKDIPFADAVIANQKLDLAPRNEISESFLESFIYAILFFYFLLFKKWNPRYFMKYIIAIIIYLGTSYFILDGLFFFKTDNIITNKFFYASIITINYILFPALLLFGVENTYSKIIIILILSANLGNAMSYLYPPYTVTDFLSFNKQTTYYDIADIYLLIKSFLILISPVFIIFHKYKKRPIKSP